MSKTPRTQQGTQKKAHPDTPQQKDQPQDQLKTTEASKNVTDANHGMHTTTRKSRPGHAAPPHAHTADNLGTTKNSASETPRAPGTGHKGPKTQKQKGLL